MKILGDTKNSIGHTQSCTEHMSMPWMLLLCRQMNDELTAKTASLVQEADAVLVSISN